MINHFLDDVAKHGRYTGFVDLGIELQRCENATVRDRRADGISGG